MEGKKHQQNYKALECTFEMIDAENKLLYASDYPHWDFDLPRTIYDLPFLSEKAKHNILGGTARTSVQAAAPQPEAERKSGKARQSGGLTGLHSFRWARSIVNLLLEKRSGTDGWCVCVGQWKTVVFLRRRKGCWRRLFSRWPTRFAVAEHKIPVERP